MGGGGTLRKLFKKVEEEAGDAQFGSGMKNVGVGSFGLVSDVSGFSAAADMLDLEKETGLEFDPVGHTKQIIEGAGQWAGEVPTEREQAQMRADAFAAGREQEEMSAKYEASRRESESYEDWQKRFGKGRNKALAERLAKLRKSGASAKGRSLLTDGMDFTPGTSSGLGPSFSL